MHFKMLSGICFNLDQSKVLSSGNGLKDQQWPEVNNLYDKMNSHLMIVLKKLDNLLLLCRLK